LPRRQAGLVLVLLGLALLGIVLVLNFCLQSREENLSFSSVPELKEEISEDLFPERILIPKVRIDLLVFPAQASEDVWEISEEGVSYLLGSGLPGRKGNLVIYGHNKNRLFGPIRWLKKDDEIKVINRRGEEFTYKIKETKTVTPAMIDVLYPTEDSTLTLYTCAGLLDRERFLVVAKLKLE
jgi:LPXTG-site transpeptidase (sortase) family protein